MEGLYFTGTSVTTFNFVMNEAKPDGSQDRFLLNVWRRKVHHCNLESSGSHSVPARNGDYKNVLFLGSGSVSGFSLCHSINL